MVKGVPLPSCWSTKLERVLEAEAVLALGEPSGVQAPKRVVLESVVDVYVEVSQ